MLYGKGLSNEENMLNIHTLQYIPIMLRPSDVGPDLHFHMTGTTLHENMVPTTFNLESSRVIFYAHLLNVV